MEENVENTKVDASIKENIETQNYTFMRGECLLPHGQAHASVDQVWLGQVKVGNMGNIIMNTDSNFSMNCDRLMSKMTP